MTVLAALRTELLFVRPPRLCVGVAARRWPSIAVLLDRQRPDAVLLVGFSAALRADLAPGDLVLASEVRNEKRAQPHAGWLERARVALPQAKFGPVHTVDRILTGADKADLGIDALVADMESAKLVAGLEALGVPWLTVRVVLDALWEELPEGIGRTKWAGRALACARRLGEASRRLASAMAEVPS